MVTDADFRRALGRAILAAMLLAFVAGAVLSLGGYFFAVWLAENIVVTHG